MTEPYTLDEDDVRACTGPTLPWGDIGQLADSILTYPKGRNVQANAQAILAKLASIEGKMGRAMRSARHGPPREDGR